MWSSCSVSCFDGISTRSKDCQGGLPGDGDCLGEYLQTKTCTNPGAYSEWEYISPCSAACGGGVRSRRRENSCTGVETEVVSCNEDPGRFSDWSKWSNCSRVCGGGEHTRSRIHSCTLEIERQTETCNEEIGSFSLWSAWTECTRSCAGGSQRRSKTHSCTGETVTEVQLCGGVYCPIWNGWSVWGPCSVSCGTGTMSRSRECRGGQPGEGFCDLSEGGSSESRECNTNECCTDLWSEWTECCELNGAQVQIKTRENRCTNSWESSIRECSSLNVVQKCSDFVDVMKLS